MTATGSLSTYAASMPVLTERPLDVLTELETSVGTAIPAIPAPGDEGGRCGFNKNN